jgi:serine/threonine protein kinase/Tol biopolymer transport system component
MQAGSRLGPYEIVAPVGAGGMGEVYRARDVRLDRHVAIKILVASLAADPVRRDRFEREARIVSSLNHPNICALYDVGREGDQSFLVLEYLEGEPLDRRLSSLRGRPLPLNLALQIGMQIADALDKAHRAGVVHRDLKPQNIFLTKNGAKLLDFGLAKLAGGANAATAPVDTAAVSAANRDVTMDGTIVGTFLYMAPEQLAGQDADVRTDIYALGLVLYEMLTGARPFEGHTETGVITAVFEREPPPMTLAVASMPSSVDRIVRTCLAKSPDDRFQSAHDVLLQLRWAAEPADAPDPLVVGRAVRRWQFAAAGLFVAVAALAARSLLTRRQSPPVLPVTRFVFPMPADQAFTRPGRRPLTISPDGTRLVYVANNELLMKSSDSLHATPILGTDDDPTEPIFSPAGESIAYWSRRSGEMRRVSIGGGDSSPIARTLNPWGDSWAGDRLLVSEGPNGIVELPLHGGQLRRIVAAVDGETLYGPELLPDGDTVVFTAKPKTTSRWDDAAVVAQSIAKGTRKVLIQGGTDAHLAPGALIYMHEATIMGVRFDAERVEIAGTPVPLVAGVAQSSLKITGAGFYAFSKSGTLVYVPGDSAGKRTVVIVDRDGHETTLPMPARAYASARLSPDGVHLALSVRELDGDVWVLDIKREVMNRLTSTRADERNPVWSGDSRSVFYMSDAGGSSTIYRIAADGSGAPERLSSSDEFLVPVSLSPDGKTLVVYQLKTGTALYEIKSIALEGDRTPQPMFTLPFTDPSIVFSPDGRWVAYASNESGRLEVYAQRFPTRNEAPVQISSDGGSTPVWRGDGREILYVDRSRRMMSVAVDAKDTLKAEKPRMLFQANYFTAALGRPFDVSADGRRFVMIKEPESTQQFVFVQQWLADAARRLR